MATAAGGSTLRAALLRRRSSSPARPTLHLILLSKEEQRGRVLYSVGRRLLLWSDVRLQPHSLRYSLQTVLNFMRSCRKENLNLDSSLAWPPYIIITAILLSCWPRAIARRPITAHMVWRALVPPMRKERRHCVLDNQVGYTSTVSSYFFQPSFLK